MIRNPLNWRVPRRHLLLALPLLFLLAFFVLPVGFLLASSTFGLPSTDPAALPRLLGPFIQFFAKDFYVGTVILTIRIASIVTIMSLLLGYPVAYYISRVGARERVYLTLLVLSPLMISLVVRSFGWVVLLSRNGPISSFLQAVGVTDEPVRLMYTESAAIAGLTHVFMPFMILAILVALQDVDDLLVRAAGSLGSSPLRTFLTITLPLSIPGVLAGCLIVFTLTASSFVTPSILGGSRLMMTASLAYEQALFTLNWPFAAAISVVLLVVSLSVIGAYAFVVRRRLFSEVFQRNVAAD